MIASETQQEIIEVYIGTFNRAPDASGLAYWVSNIENSGWSINDVATSMFDSSEVALEYPDTLTNEQFLNQVYNNVLGRNGDSEGIAYWLTQMDAGIQRSQMITTIINGAKADSGSAQDKALLENKKDAAIYFALDLASDDISLASKAMTVITNDVSTVQVSKDLQDLAQAISDDTLSIVLGDSTNNILNGTEANNFIYADEGDDTILATEGDNTIVAGNGKDTIQTGEGIDIIKSGNGDDTIYANGGDDMIYGHAGNDSIHGEDGDDTINAGSGDDYIYGDDGSDILYGEDGADTIYGGNGDDIINAGTGNDNVYAKDGTNYIDGDMGNDTIYGGLGIDTIYGGAGDDLIYGQEGDDILDGLIDNDTIYGGAGNDIVNGNEGNDILYGGTGDDNIDAEEGNDTLYGGKGADTLSGGEGQDNFIFTELSSNLTTYDTLLDFTYSNSGLDTLTFLNQGDEIINSTTTNVISATTLQEAADLASTGDGSINGIVNWFIYEDNTYVVEDLNVLDVFDDTTDSIIKLQGNIDLDGLDSDTIMFM